MIKINAIFIEGKAWWTGFEVESAKRCFRMHFNNLKRDDIIMMDESVHSKVFNSHVMPEKLIFHPEHEKYDHLLIAGKSLGGINVFETFRDLFDNHLEFLKTRKSISLVFGDAYGTFLNFKYGFKTYGSQNAMVIPEEWKKTLKNLKIYNAYQRVKSDPFMGAYIVGTNRQYEFHRCEKEEFNNRPHMNFMAHPDWKIVINDIVKGIEK